jgi:hypothetical protein
MDLTLRNIIVRGTVTTNIQWWKHATINNHSQPTNGSVRIKVSSIKVEGRWKSVDYSLHTGGYTQVIPFIEILYSSREDSLESMYKGQNIEMILNVPALYMNEHSVEIKEEYKSLYLKIPHQYENIPIIREIPNLSLRGEDKRIISTTNLVNLLIPQEEPEFIMVEDSTPLPHQQTVQRSISEQLEALIA